MHVRNAIDLALADTMNHNAWLEEIARAVSEIATVNRDLSVSQRLLDIARQLRAARNNVNRANGVLDQLLVLVRRHQIDFDIDV